MADELGGTAQTDEAISAQQKLVNPESYNTQPENQDYKNQQQTDNQNSRPDILDRVTQLERELEDLKAIVLNFQNMTATTVITCNSDGSATGQTTFAF